MRKFFLSSVILASMVFSASIGFAETMEQYVETIKQVFGNNDLGRLIKTYGKPDNDDSTAYDKPRPPLVTRWITYYKADVKAISVPDAKNSYQPPPYKNWKIIGFTDSNSKIKLSAEETKQRLDKQLR